MKKTGAITEVSDGYARNYLIPNGLATPATDRAVQDDSTQRANAAKEREQKEVEWNAYVEQFSTMVVEVHGNANDEGVLFGALTNSAILTELRKHNVVLEEEWLHIDAPIKKHGNYTITVEFPHNKKAQLHIRVI